MIEHTRELLTTLSHVPAVKNLDSAECDPFFYDLNQIYPRYSGFSLATPDGTVFSSSFSSTKSINFSGRPWYSKLVQTRNFVVGEYQPGRMSGKLIAVCAYPIIDDENQLKAILTAGIDLSWLSEFIKGAKLPPEASVTLVDQSGRVLARYPHPEQWIGKDVRHLSPFKEMLSNYAGGTVRAKGLDEEHKIFAFRHLDDPPEGEGPLVCFGISEEAVFAEAKRDLVRNLTLLAIAVAAALAVAKYLGNAFVRRPVNDLLATIGEVKEGDLKARTRFSNSEGELGRLAQAFNEMTDSLQQREAARKQAEDALRRSEAKYRSLFENVFDVVFSIDRELKIFSLSPSVERILGYKPDELIGRPLPELNVLTPEHFETAISDVNRVFDGDYLEPSSYEFIAKDGSRKFGEVSATPLIEAGKVVSVVAVARDVTEKKVAEKALLRVNQMLKTLSQCNQCLVRATEEVNLINQVCQLMVEIGGYRFAWVGFAEQDAEKSVRPVALAGFEDGYLESIEITWADTVMGQSPVGTAILTRMPAISKNIEADPNFAPWRDEAIKRGYASSMSLPLVADDQIIGALNVYDAEVDVFDEEEVKLLSELADDLAYGIMALRIRQQHEKATEELRLEKEKFRLLIEESPLGVSIIGEDGEYKYFSPQFFKLFGYTLEDVPTGRDWFRKAFPDEEYRKQVISTWSSYTKGPAPDKPVSQTFDVTCKDGSKKTIKFFSVKMETGEQFVVYENITEQKKLEAQFFQAQKMEAVGRLAGGVAHDFNNLMTVVMGFSELVLEKLREDDPIREKLDEIFKAGKRATNLTRQLLAFSRKQVIRPYVLDLNNVVVGFEKMLRRLIGEDIELETNLESDLGRVKADPGQLEQVIMNLAVNARDAMPKGGKLTIVTQNVFLDETYARKHGVELQPGSYVMLVVGDTGVGMNKEILSKIFEPFYTTKEKGQGTGLGLATVYGIVKQNGGYIWVDSEPDQGATFKIYLPRIEEKANSVQKEQAEKIELSGSETILIVEDDNSLRNLVRMTLKSYGYNVLDSRGGGEALEISRQHKGSIHLLLTDVVMPEISGRQLAEQITTEQPKLKVLYMSGYTDNVISHHGILEDDVNFIEKPFTPKSIAQAVRRILDELKRKM